MSDQQPESDDPSVTPPAEGQAGAFEVIGSMEGTATAENLARNFFANNGLIAYQVRSWCATKVISDEELKAWGVSDLDGFKQDHTKGSKQLVPKEVLKPMQDIKTAADKYVKARSAPFSSTMPGLRLVRREKQAEVMLYLRNEVKPKLEEAVDKVIADGDYDRAKEEMITKWMSDTPSVPRGLFESQYPTHSQLRQKFGVECSLWGSPADADVEEHVRTVHMEAIAEETERFVRETNQKLREQVVQVFTGFTDVLKGKEEHQKVNERSIRKVKDFIASFGALNFSGDKKLAATIAACERKFGQMQAWTVEEVNSLGLEGVISEALVAARDDVAMVQAADAYMAAATGGEVDEELLSDDIGTMVPLGAIDASEDEETADDGAGMAAPPVPAFKD